MGGGTAVMRRCDGIISDGRAGHSYGPWNIPESAVQNNNTLHKTCAPFTYVIYLFVVLLQLGIISHIELLHAMR